MKFVFIQEHRDRWPVRMMCDVLAVTRSGFYAWLHRQPSARQVRREKLAEKIARVHAVNRGVYGSPRVHQALLAEGEKVCKHTVAKIMQHERIRDKTKRKYVPRTTDSAHEHRVAENVLDRQFSATAPNCKWVTDITYIATDEGWLYLAAVLDLASRRIVGWSMADHMRSELVGDALQMALSQRCPPPGLLHHSDRGVQYASDDYQTLLNQHGITCSMSGRGDCYGNAAMESFWSTLKTELVHHETYATRETARTSIFEYIEVFYNRQRLHSSLRYQSPESFEAAQN